MLDNATETENAAIKHKAIFDAVYNKSSKANSSNTVNPDVNIVPDTNTLVVPDANTVVAPDKRKHSGVHSGKKLQN